MAMNLPKIVLFTIILQQCGTKIIIILMSYYRALCFKLSVLQVILEAYSIIFMVIFKDFFGNFFNNSKLTLFFPLFNSSYLSKIGAKPTLDFKCKYSLHDSYPSSTCTYTYFVLPTISVKK